MKYYIVDYLQRIGDYEDREKTVISLDSTPANLNELAHKLAREQRGSDLDDWDDSMGAYWFGDGVTFVPEIREIPEADFNVLSKYL